MEKPVAYVLHGFLGLPSDWDEFEGVWSIGDQPIELRKVNLYQERKALDDKFTIEESAVPPFTKWAKHFNEKVVAEIRSEIKPKAKPETQKPFLIGYSLGGRLAMAALTAAPDLWAGAVIVSANPGLEEKSDHIQRIRDDDKWAERFANEDWETLMKAWNGQAVFQRPKLKLVDQNYQASPPQKNREEKDFDRHSLSRVLTSWSLGVQPNFREDLQRISTPVCFVTGRDDTKFTGLIRDLKKPISQSHIIVENSGHRVPWENPDVFAQAVQKFFT